MNRGDPPVQFTDVHGSSDALLRLGLDLTTRLGNNVTVSPLSIGLALALLAGGAEGVALDTLCGILGVKRDQLVEAYKQHTRLLSTYGDKLVGGNAVFAERNFAISNAFKTYVAELDAVVKQDHFKLSDAATDINEFVKDKTHGAILHIVSPAELATAHLALVNALAFKDTWAHAFKPADTKSHSFGTPSGLLDSLRPGGRKVDMMFMPKTRINTADTDDYTAVCLPFMNGALFFLAWLPKKDIANTIVAVKRDGVPRQFVMENVGMLGLPKAEIECRFELCAHLAALGVPLDNFPRLGPGPHVVNSIIHVAKLEWNETGAKGAAATVVIVSRSLALAKPKMRDIVFDQPFVYAIVAPTGAPLFTGVYK